MRAQALFFFCVILFSKPLLGADFMTVTQRTLERGTVIGAADLQERDITGKPKQIGILSASDVMGKELRRTISEGQPIYTNDVQSPLLVRRNQLVTMVISKGGLSIAASGKVMDDGSKGAIIRVQNTGSKNIIEAEVVANGVVRVAALAMPQIPSGF